MSILNMHLMIYFPFYIEIKCLTLRMVLSNTKIFTSDMLKVSQVPTL